MKHLFVSYELTLKLKEKGFDEECLGLYYKDGSFAYNPDSDVFVGAPLYQQVIDWFREKHNIYIEIKLGIRNNLLYIGEIYTIRDTYKSNIKLTNYFDSYYKALTEAIEETLKLI